MATGAIMKAVRTVSGNSPAVSRIIEKATQTFKSGVPGQLVGGAVQEWDGVTVAAAIAGIIADIGSNLVVDGTAVTQSFGSVPNQASAVNIARGAPMNDGKVSIEVASQDTVFQGKLSAAHAASDIGKTYGLTKGTDGQWYVDKAKVGVTAVVSVVGRDTDFDVNAVYFTFLPAAVQLVA